MTRSDAMQRQQRPRSFLPDGAAPAAALFLFVLVFGLGLGSIGVLAKMREERLALLTAGGERVVTIEVAATPEEQSYGLMFRTELADTRGMLFPHEQAREVNMWMRNTYISLDMVFIRADGIVHRIEARTEPLSERIIASQGDVTAVLELAGGAAERLGLKAGDRVVYPPTFPAPKW